MKFLKALTQKKLAKAVVCGLVLSGGMLVGMGQAFAATYISGAVTGKDFGGSPSLIGTTGVTVVVTDKGTGSDYNGEYIYGVCNPEKDSSVGVENGKVFIEGGAVTSQVYGGGSFNGTAIHNTLIVEGGKSTSYINGGFSNYNNAKENTLNIKGGTVSSVYGGRSVGGDAIGNIVNITNGECTGGVYGGYSMLENAVGNVVNISGGKMTTVRGGSASGQANDNIVNLIGEGGVLEVAIGYKEGKLEKKYVENTADINITKTVYGGTINSEGNTLNVAGTGTKVGNIANFQNINFYIQDSLTYGDTMVNITGTAKTDIKGAKVNVIVEAEPKANEKDADLKSINLLANKNGIEWKENPTKGAELNKEDYNIILLDGVKLQVVEDNITVALNDDKTAMVLTLAEAEPKPEPDPDPDPKPEQPTIATPAATPLFEAIKDNKAKLSEKLQGFVENLMARVDGNNLEASAANVKAAISGAYQATEITGTTSTAVSVTNNVSNLTFGRMSLGGSAEVGGKGVGLMAHDSGADVWARYVHGKDKADGINMDGGSSDYSNTYNGFVVGADFKKVGKFQSGISFSYVKGSGSNSFKDIMGATARYGHTDFHTYNFGYYGSVKNDDTNTMFDLSYGTTSSDSDTNGVGGAQSFSAKSKIFNAGVTAERSFDVSGMKLVPYTGLRYMHVDGGEYTDSLGINHKADKQNVFMLPVGLKLSKENKLSHDWTLTPKVDLSYTWNMGDTDSEMTVSVPGLTSSRLGYSVMDTGSFMGVAGIEAQRKNWTYGVSYAYQKGSHQDSKKIIADIKMSF